MTEEIVPVITASSRQSRRGSRMKRRRKPSTTFRAIVCDENAMMAPAHTASMTKADSESWPVCAVWSQ